MLYFVQILYLTSTVNSFKWSIGGELNLGPEWRYKYNMGEQEQQEISKRTMDDNTPVGHNRSRKSDFKDSESFEEAAEIPQRTIGTIGSTHNSITTFTNRNEQSPRSKLKLYFRYGNGNKHLNGPLVTRRRRRKRKYKENPIPLKEDDEVLTPIDNIKLTTTDEQDLLVKDSTVFNNLTRMAEEKEKAKALLPSFNNVFEFINKSESLIGNVNNHMLNLDTWRQQQLKTTNAAQKMIKGHKGEAGASANPSKKWYKEWRGDATNTPDVKQFNKKHNGSLKHQKHHKSYHDFGKFPLRISQDAQIELFANEILRDTLEIFNDIINNTTDPYWKTRIDDIARNYEGKFQEFLKTTRRQRIKTKLGPQKVVLNAIDVSNRIVNRLLNIYKDEMDRQGLIQNNKPTHILQRSFNKGVETHFKRACLNLGICVAYPGFTQFMTEVLTTMLILTNDKFNQTFQSLTEAVKNTDFSETLGDKMNASSMKLLRRIAGNNTEVQKAMVMIVKNLFANRNMPLIVYEDSDPVSSNLNATLAFLEIINILEERVPDSIENIKQWDKIKRELKKYAYDEDDTVNVQVIMKKLILHVKDIIDRIDENAWDMIRRNTKTMFAW